MKNKIWIFIIASFAVLLLTIALQAQTDSIRGYYKFNFGMKYNDAINLLRDKNITYDTTETFMNMFFNTISITYNDKVELDFLNEYDIEVELGFSPYFGDTFIRADLNSELECFDLEHALLKGDELVNIFEQKYGTMTDMENYYDSTKQNHIIFNDARIIKYYWQLLDGFIMVSVSYLDFFSEEILDEYTKNYKKEKKTKGYLDIRIMYVSEKWSEHLSIVHNKRDMEEELKKEENLKKF